MAEPSPGSADASTKPANLVLRWPGPHFMQILVGKNRKSRGIRLQCFEFQPVSLVIVKQKVNLPFEKASSSNSGYVPLVFGLEGLRFGPFLGVRECGRKRSDQGASECN